jgi:hypothetical protein
MSAGFYRSKTKMIKSISAHTENLDDLVLAVQELHAQIGPVENLLSHSVGIIACHYEFINAGITDALAKALPFPIMGISSTPVAINPMRKTLDSNLLDSYLSLSLLVLTSDDVRFETAVTDEIREDRGNARECIKSLFEGREKPVMVLSYGPNINVIPGDLLVNAAHEYSQAPIFGGLSVDDSDTFTTDTFVISSEGAWRNRLGFVLVYGNVKPSFYAVSVSPANILEKTALVTSSQGSVIYSLDNKPPMETLLDMGVTKESVFGVITYLTLIAYDDDLADTTHSPYYSRVILQLNEDGSISCGGEVPQGSTIRVGYFEKDDLITAARNTALRVFEEMKAGRSSGGTSACVLVYSCATRSVQLGADILAEVDMLREVVGESPFLFAYAGGEICPIYYDKESGKSSNKFHNNTFCICVL